MKTVNERLQFWLKSQRISQTELAKNIGVTPAAINNIIHGRSNPTALLLKQLHQAYPNLNQDWLLNGQGQMLREGAASGFPVSDSALTPDVLDLLRSQFGLQQKQIGLQEQVIEELRDELRFYRDLVRQQGLRLVPAMGKSKLYQRALTVTRGGQYGQNRGTVFGTAAA